MLTYTPQIAAEVRRNLFLLLLAFACCVALVSGLVLLSVDPTSPTLSRSIRVVVVNSIPFALESTMLLILAYPMGCWAAFIRAKRLPDLVGIPPDSVSRRVLSSRQGEPGYRPAFDKGGKLSVLFVMIWTAVSALGLRSKWRGMFPFVFLIAFVLLLSAGAVSVRAWAVQRAVEERDARAAGEPPPADE
jgi:hypothetical protein